ncbi:unnamed protein product, partial [marine sediment metagenome]
MFDFFRRIKTRAKIKNGLTRVVCRCRGCGAVYYQFKCYNPFKFSDLEKIEDMYKMLDIHACGGNSVALGIADVVMFVDWPLKVEDDKTLGSWLKCGYVTENYSV